MASSACLVSGCAHGSLVPSSGVSEKRVGFLPAGLEATAEAQFKMLEIELNFGPSLLFSKPPEPVTLHAVSVGGPRECWGSAVLESGLFDPSPMA